MGLAFVAAVTVLFLLFFTDPELLDKVWLWLVGLAGYILVLLEKGFKSLSQLFEAKGTLPQQPTHVDSAPSDENIRTKIETIEDRILRIETQLMQEKKILDG